MVLQEIVITHGRTLRAVASLEEAVGAAADFARACKSATTRRAIRRMLPTLLLGASAGALRRCRRPWTPGPAISHPWPRSGLNDVPTCSGLQACRPVKL